MENVSFVKDGVSKFFDYVYNAKVNKIKAIMAESKDAKLWTDVSDSLMEIIKKYGLEQEFKAYIAAKRK